ncbi:hypothetical protein [Oligosphaera ethanolica]|uniref:Uncharacterized protein n=1 Tax=Oligosphaera ethanolica TaxID=760260 RepID=A0AAE3VEA8_9BACT|nr:hypothetical protein [Oligosphaera ethanolica]MDQ0288735.1 hypothetical protein [Oligosphaera ethanolica]
MRITILTLTLSLLAVAQPQAIFFQAEDLPFAGDWTKTSEGGALGRSFLMTPNEDAVRPAVGFIAIPHDGSWQLWVRSRDFPKDRPGTRRFVVEINGQRSQREFGAHAVDNPQAPAWQWEDGGSFDLEAGPAIVALQRITPWSRADAIALVPTGASLPRTQDDITTAKVLPATSPDKLAAAAAADRPGVNASPAHAQDSGRVLARLDNDAISMIFSAGSRDGQDVVMLRVDCRSENGGATTIIAPRLECYDVLKAHNELTIDGRRAGILVNWLLTPRDLKVSYHDISYDTRMSTTTGNPEECGDMLHFLPKACRQLANAVELQAENTTGTITARWELAPSELFPRLTLTFTPNADGVYGLRYAATAPVSPEDVEEISCPFLHAYRRLPAGPELIPSELTATPMATVQTAGPHCAGIAIAPADLPTAWPDCREFEAGFQLANSDGHAQPAAWLVIPGASGSARKAGESVSARAYLIARADDWFETYRAVTNTLCNLRDYRQNHGNSLTDVLLNTISLMADDDASGWSPAQMGFWNIESKNTVTHAAPLSLVMAAMLTRDDDLLARRAAPALAFLLSRPDQHAGAVPAAPGRYGRFNLGQPTRMYGAAVRLSAWQLTGGYSPQFCDLAFTDDGTPQRGNVHAMDDALGAYQATGEQRHLEIARQEAIDYARNYLQNQNRDINPVHFFQVTHTGNWRGLLAVAEATGDQELARMANEIARRMIVGLYTWPVVQPGMMTIHQGNRTRTNGWIWLKGDKLFLLGWPNSITGVHPTTHEELDYLSVPEKEVPGWLPSVVGLGIEQPTTYRRGQGTCAHIIMANWAPHLLRLDALTPEPLFRTAAHNAVLGRWGNYPGYYRTDFTDITSNTDYPLQGPDVSGIYWHHIPCFLMMVADYLVTDLEVRSAGAIAFPAGRQCGYVWFDNRLFGHQPGRVFDRQDVWPWLPRKGVSVDRPELNWLAGYDDDSVYIFLSNTSNTAVESTVTLDLTHFTGDIQAVFSRQDKDHERPRNAAGSQARITVSPQGLSILRFQGLQPPASWQRAKTPLLKPADGYRAEVSTDGLAGTVRANWLGFGPDRAFAHIYSDHQGDKADRAELHLEQNGVSESFTRDFWPAEFVLPIDATMPAQLTLTVIDRDGQRHSAPSLTIAPPYTK